MAIPDRDERGRVLFARMKFWTVSGLSVAAIASVPNMALLIWSGYINTVESNTDLDTMTHAFNSVSTIVYIPLLISVVFTVVSIALGVYYYMKTAEYLGIESYRHRKISDVYIEMRRIAKEKKWI